ALLDAVREARAASEEENFCERGREKALLLMQQQQYSQAVDLLRNLLLLFPGNAILERDLAAAQSAAGHAVAATPLSEPEPEPEGPPEPPAMVAPVPVTLRMETPVNLSQRTVVATPASGSRKAVIVGAASLLLVSGGVAAWRFSRTAPPAPTRAAI